MNSGGSPEKALGTAILNYGRVGVVVLVTIIGFAVWAVPTYLISQQTALAAERFCTRQEAMEMVGKAAEQTEKRMGDRLNRMEDKIDKIYDRITSKP